MSGALRLHSAACGRNQKEELNAEVAEGYGDHREERLGCLRNRRFQRERA